MPLSLEVRRDRLSRFVLRAMQAKKIQEQWTVEDVLKATLVGKTTLYRWINKDWTQDPQGALIEKFCDGMGIPAAEGFAQLWPGLHGEAIKPAVVIPQDVELLLRRLVSPDTTDTERQIMLGLVRQAANVRVEEASQPRRRRAS